MRYTGRNKRRDLLVPVLRLAGMILLAVILAGVAGMTRQAPCHRCPDRRVGCHDEAVCEKWAAFQAAVREARPAEEARKRAAWELACYLKSRRNQQRNRPAK